MCSSNLNRTKSRQTPYLLPTMGHPLWTQLQLSEKPEYFSKKDQAKVAHTFYVKKKKLFHHLGQLHIKKQWMVRKDSYSPNKVQQKQTNKLSPQRTCWRFLFAGPVCDPNLYLIGCCCSCGTRVVYLSGSKCLVSVATSWIHKTGSPNPLWPRVRVNGIIKSKCFCLIFHHPSPPHKSAASRWPSQSVRDEAALGDTFGLHLGSLKAFSN